MPDMTGNELRRCPVPRKRTQIIHEILDLAMDEPLQKLIGNGRQIYPGLDASTRYRNDSEMVRELVFRRGADVLISMRDYHNETTFRCLLLDCHLALKESTIDPLLGKIHLVLRAADAEMRKRMASAQRRDHQDVEDLVDDFIGARTRGPAADASPQTGRALEDQRFRIEDLRSVQIVANFHE